MSVYDETIMSEEDKKRLAAAGAAYNQASAKGDTAGMESAHNLAESIRKAYGYSGGTDGSQYIKVDGYEGAEKVKEASEDLNAAYSGIAEAYKQQAQAQKETVDNEVSSVLRDAYITNQLSKRNLDQSLKARGISGGITESTKAQLAQNYENNRIATQKAGIAAKKEIDLDTTAKLAENELNRANARYNADMTEAQFENTAASNQRAIEQQTISKYTSFIQNGLIDDSNVSEVANILGISEESVRVASDAAKNAEYANVALSLLSEGVYDDSFVGLLGNRFSAQTLKTYASSRKSASNGGSSGRAEGNVTEDKDIDLETVAKTSNYGSGWSEDNWSELATAYGVTITELKNYFDNLRMYDKPVGAFEEALVKAGLTKNEWSDWAAANNYGSTSSVLELRQAARELGVNVPTLTVWLSSEKNKN